MASQDMTSASLPNNHLSQAHETMFIERHATEDLDLPAHVDHFYEPGIDDQQTTTASQASLTHDSAIQTPRENFPLPRELRDHIYSYLLDSKHTKVKRAHVGDRAYKFHTNILGVNRQIHGEAEKYLYKHNIFVVISHQFSDPDIPATGFIAPFVAKLSSAEFTHRSLEVRLSEVTHVDSEQSEIPGLHWLFLSNDLDLYRRIVSMPLINRLQQAPILVLHGGGLYLDRLIEENGQQNYPDHMKIKFCRHRYSQSSRELQASLLAPLSILKRPGLLVTLSGDILDHASARDFECSMDVHAAFFSTINWHVLKAVDDIRGAADASAQAGESTVAARMYETVTKALKGILANPAWQAPDIASAVLTSLLNTLLTMSSLYMKAKDQTNFAQTVASILCLVGPSPEREEDRGPMSSCIFHLHMLAMTVAPFEVSLPPLPRITIAECIARLSIYESYYQAHDIAILKKCADQNKIFEPNDLPAASCSFFAMSNLMCGFGKPLSLPDHIIGFFDVLELRKIDKEQREQINKLQAERGWRITRFEDYDEADSRGGAA